MVARKKVGASGEKFPESPKLKSPKPRPGALFPKRERGMSNPSRTWTEAEIAILTGPDTARDAAKKLNVGPHVVYRWRGLRQRPSTLADPNGDARRSHLDLKVRIAHAGLLLYKMPDVEIILDLCQTFGIDPRVARNDVTAARQALIDGAIAERPAIRAMATQQFKEIAHAARADRDFGPAVAAWREIARMHGAYEPDVVQIQVPGALDVGDVLKVLSARGKEAYDVILEEIEAARVAGQLPQLMAGSDDVIDAEIVEPDAAASSATEGN